MSYKRKKTVLNTDLENFLISRNGTRVKIKF